MWGGWHSEGNLTTSEHETSLMVVQPQVNETGLAVTGWMIEDG